MIFPIHRVVFYVFSILLLCAAVMVITAKNPVRAVLFLVVAFFASAVLWMLTQAEFLSLVLIFVYVGAVMTLFLFVVMMLRIETSDLKIGFVRYYPFGLLALVLLVALSAYVFSLEHWHLAQSQLTHYGSHYDNVKVMGNLLFTTYLYPFEISSAILLVGMVSAIVLAFHGKKPGTKSQEVSQQLLANKKDRLRIIDLKGKQ